MAEETSPQTLTSDDEINEIRAHLATIENKPGTSQAHISRETLIYKFHIQIARLNELAAQQGARISTPIRPPDLERQQQLEREITALQSKFDAGDGAYRELMDVNQQWNTQYALMMTKASEEKQQLNNKIREQASRIEFLSTIQPSDIPSDDVLSQLNNDNEELKKNVHETTNENAKLKKKIERLELLLEEDETSAEILHKKVADMIEENKKLRAEEKKNVNEYKVMQEKCGTSSKELEDIKKKEKEASEKLKKVTEERDKLKEDVTKSKQEYKALQAKVILGLLGEEKKDAKKDDKSDKKKKKKVRLYDMSPQRPPYYASYIDELSDPLSDDLIPPRLKAKPSKHRRSFSPKLSKLSDWDKNFETLDYPYFPNPYGNHYFSVDSD